MTGEQATRSTTSPLKMSTLEVGPEVAQKLLDTMSDNRPLSQSNLEKIVAAMRGGRWHHDGTPLRFNADGQLIDGQHRLTAIIETGMTTTFFVVHNVPDAAMTTLDTGRSRSPGDILKIHDPEVTDVTQVASVSSMILRWNLGVRGQSLTRSRVENDSLVILYDSDKENLVEAGRVGRRVNRGLRGGSATAFGVADYFFRQLDEADTLFFWDRLVSGDKLEKGDPIYALRELIRRDALRGSTRDRLRADVVLALTIKSWNAYREGREIHSLMFRAGGASPEIYPEPV
jgi:hypothetical protein